MVSECENEDSIPSCAAAIIRRGRMMTIFFVIFPLLVALLAIKLAVDLIQLLQYASISGYGLHTKQSQGQVLTPEEGIELAREVLQHAPAFIQGLGTTEVILWSLIVGFSAVATIQSMIWRKPEHNGRYSAGVIDLSRLNLPKRMQSLQAVKSKKENTVKGNHFYISLTLAGKIRLHTNVFRFVAFHEYFHLRSFDRTATLFVKRLSTIVDIPVVAYFGFAIGIMSAIWLLPAWLPTIINVFLTFALMLAFGFFFDRMLRLDLQSYSGLKEFLADQFAQAAVPDASYERVYGGNAKAHHFWLYWQDRPEPMERKRYLRAGATDRVVIFLAALIFKWALFRSMAFGIAHQPLTVTLSIAGFDIAMAITIGMLAAIILPITRNAEIKTSALSIIVLYIALAFFGLPLAFFFIIWQLQYELNMAVPFLPAMFFVSPVMPFLVATVIAFFYYRQRHRQSPATEREIGGEHIL